MASKLYHFDKCSKVGDSFAVYITRNQDLGRIHRSVGVQACRFVRLFQPDWKFSVKIEREPIVCVRVTRIA